jgi:hypothetical protein
MAAEEVGVSARRPKGEAQLERALDSEFLAVMRDRIKKSVAVVGLFLPGDVSVPIELAIASELHRPILVIHQSSILIPRLLPGIRAEEEEDEQKMTGKIASFLRRALSNQRPEV